MRYLRGVERTARAVAVCAAALPLTGVLAGCGGSTARPSPPAHSPAEREWLDNADRFIGILDSDVLLSTAGGANLATARHALGDESAVYAMTVAYTFFGSCGRSLANAGTPSTRESHLAETLIGACRRLQHASTLFEQAMSRGRAQTLLAATRLVLGASPLLAQAKTELASLRAHR
jgi:hypothetical protein